MGREIEGGLKENAVKEEEYVCVGGWTGGKKEREKERRKRGDG